MQLPTKCSCNHLHFCFATFYIFILQQTDEALEADVDDFADALYKVKECSKNIIDSYTQPFYGLVKFAREEPETVQQMFMDLYSDDGGNVKKQMELIQNFFIQSNELLEKILPFLKK